MTANVRVVVDSRDNVLKVANAALRFRPAGLSEAKPGEKGGRGTPPAGRVWMIGEEGQPKPVDVRIGLTDGTSTEFVEGPLTEGAEVILGIGNPAAETKNETPRRR